VQAPYTDPATGLRYHDKSVYDVIKGLVCIIESAQLPPQTERIFYRALVLLRNIYQVRVATVTYPTPTDVVQLVVSILS
jgi:hypothetical protein